jgi:hypothetical protein
VDLFAVAVQKSTPDSDAFSFDFSHLTIRFCRGQLGPAAPRFRSRVTSRLLPS